MKLTEDQERKIQHFVDAQGLEIVALRDDILDHLCCVVENELQRGKTFDQSLEDAVSELAPMD